MTQLMFASWLSDRVYPLSTGLTFWRVPSCHRAKWCGSWRVLPSGQRCLSLGQAQRTGSEFLWWSLKVGTPTGTKRTSDAWDHVKTSQWLDIHSQSDIEGAVCRGHTSNSRQGANSVFTSWMDCCVCRHAWHPIQALESREHYLCLLCSLCVGLSMCANIQDSKRVFWLQELLCEIRAEAKPRKCPSADTFTIIFFYSGLACLCMCVSVWGRQRQKPGWDAWAEHLFG